MGSPSAYSLRALETARQCVMLGARLRTIAHITGLTPGYILRAVYCERYPAPIGRPQYSEDFFFKTTRRLQAEACFLATHYRRLTSEGFRQADALIAAFRHHRATQPESTLGFDQAFFLISRLDGIWAATKSGLSFVECLNCRSPYLAPHGMPQRDSCPVCRTDWRLKSRARARVRTSTPPALAADPPKPKRSRQDVPWQLDLDIAHVRLLGRLQQLDAGRHERLHLPADAAGRLVREDRGHAPCAVRRLRVPLQAARPPGRHAHRSHVLGLRNGAPRLPRLPEARDRRPLLRGRRVARRHLGRAGATARTPAVRIMWLALPGEQGRAAPGRLSLLHAHPATPDPAACDGRVT